ncbi:MAG TPA: class I adenylate-forming enzyme family protein [Xanthobacteraceae bacterium]|nr:class I adenylate-forming enzyme family protein [Xanthobacteraceae bacterium]
MRAYLTLHEPKKARAWYAAGLWRDETCYHLLARHARERPADIAAVDGTRQLGWAAFQLWVDALAEDLVAHGLTPGDRVSIFMSNRLEAVAMFLACARAGLACNPSLHRTHTCAEVAALLNRLSARALLAEPGWGADGATADFSSALAQVPSLVRVYRPDELPPPRQTALAAPACGDPDSVRYLAFTSGTTGAPKCVMHSDNTLLANARDMVRDWRHGPHTRLLTLSPISHHIAWVAVAQWLVAGCTLILDDPPQGMSRLDWLVETQATYVMGVPTHAMDLLAEQARRGMTRLGAAEVFYMAGAPIPPTVCEAFVRQGIKPQNVYGMTENSSHQYTHLEDDAQTIVSTCGRGGPAYEIKLFDPTDADREVPTGTVGQIGGKGAALMLGYFGNQEATEASFNRDGWFLSGDLGVLDEAGNLRIEGRLKDLIIRGGHNIYPAHIEALALRHEQVERVAVFPVRDDRLGERACIAVIGATAPEALLRHLEAQGLSKFDMPEYFLRMDSFPLTASGKILKRELIAMAVRGEISPQPIRFNRAKEVA